MKVSVEVLALRADLEGQWSYRHITVTPAPGEGPDEAARRACGLTAQAPSSVVHSTSWRYRPEGQLVLTYAVCPDPAPEQPAIVLPELEIARGAAPATPAPEHVEVRNVVAHAVQHLAFLMVTDEVVRQALLNHPDIATALAEQSVGAQLTS